MTQIFTAEEIAAHFKIEVSYVKRMVRQGFRPCWRPTANSRQVRFTEENLREIEGAIQLATVSSSTGRKTK